MRCGSLDHLEFCEGFLVYGEAEAGKIIVKIHETVFSFWFTVEDIPEKFVADFDVHDGEIFGHGGIQAGHYYVVVMHQIGSTKPSLAFGSPSKIYQKSSLPTSTSTMGKYSAMGEFRLAITTW